MPRHYPELRRGIRRCSVKRFKEQCKGSTERTDSTVASRLQYYSQDRWDAKNPKQSLILRLQQTSFVGRKTPTWFDWTISPAP